MIPTIRNLYFAVHQVSLTDKEVHMFSVTLPSRIFYLVEERGWEDPGVHEQIREVILVRKEMADHSVIAPVHDIVYDIFNISMSNNDVLAYAATLPTEIHSLAEQWGWQDTEVKRKIYTLIEERKKNTTR